MKTLGQVYPPLLLMMILFVQIVSLFVNYSIYDFQELIIFCTWIPLVTLPYLLTKKKIVYRIVVTVFFIGGLLNLCHLVILKGPISASSLFVLLNTNINEAKEFMELKTNFLMLLIIPYIVLYIVALKNVKPVKLYPKSKYIIGAILLFSIVFLSENLIHGRFVRKATPQTTKALISFADEIKSYKALKKRKVADIEAKLNSTDSGERIFVLIIGESCNRNHMSLYNYSKATNPKLEKRDDIIIYGDVVSAYSNTLGSILSSLTESNLENKMSFDKSISLIDIFHSLEFQTIWLSNQSPIGVWDNATYNLAQTSDIPIFINNSGNTSFESTYLSSYDELLFRPFNSVLNSSTKSKFIVIHLMGSHSSYSKRYPSEYNKFNDYSTKKERIINEYDNSVLYNDFIVDSLLNILDSYCLKNNKTICSCIYLSDHGENVYDEGDNVGHDYSGSLPKSNVEIPFIVWLSPNFKILYSNKLQTVLSNKNMPFVSDDLFHTIIDLNDIDCKEFSEDRSIFNQNFNFARPRILEDNMDYDLK